MEIPDYCEVPQCTVSALCADDRKHTLTRIICLERCVVPELIMLWNMGIHTVCSCCGHGYDEKAYIRVEAEDAPRMEALGYERFETHECQMYSGSVSFRAKGVKAEREKGKPEDLRSWEEIRSQWREKAGLTEEMKACLM